MISKASGRQLSGGGNYDDDVLRRCRLLRAEGPSDGGGTQRKQQLHALQRRYDVGVTVAPSGSKLSLTVPDCRSFAACEKSSIVRGLSRIHGRLVKPIHPALVPIATKPRTPGPAGTARTQP